MSDKKKYYNMKLQKVISLFLAVSSSLFALGQSNYDSDAAAVSDTVDVADSDALTRSVELDEIVVSASMIENGNKLSAVKLKGKMLQGENIGLNLPYLMLSTPSLVAFSEDGTGAGYSYFRIRGTDQNRINITLNGIPLNDSESSTVVWVNMTDLVGSVSSIDIQRGVGSSSNGAAAFGASINMHTEEPSPVPYAQISFNGGSYGTFHELVKAGTGLMKHGFAIDARYSKVDSKGYVDHAFSDLYSYFASAAWYGEKTMVKVQTLGGAEKTGIAWDGTDPEQWRRNARYNPSGLYVDKDGQEQRYDDATDNYKQRHYQIHVSHIFNDNWSINAAAHYTLGEGWSEDVQHKALSKFGMTDIVDDQGNVLKPYSVREKHMKNHFYGGIINAHYRSDKWNVSFGGAASHYFGKHYGYIDRLLSGEQCDEQQLRKHWYDNRGHKTDANIYAKATWNPIEGLGVYADMQYRFIRYNINGTHDKKVGLKMNDWGDDFHFFNPKVGINYKRGGHSLYANFAIANREPNRKNYTESGLTLKPKKETLYDTEAGYSFTHRVFAIGVNLYYMHYKNQLVPSGKVSDTGSTLTMNVDKSYRMGIELMGSVKIGRYVRWDANVTVSRNKIVNFSDWVDDYATGEQVEINYGTTTIAFSPSVTAGSTLTFQLKGFEAAWQTNYVGKQWLDNTESGLTKLPHYCINNLRLAYKQPVGKILKDITFSLNLNNIFNTSYVANGWASGYFNNYGQDTTESKYIGYYAQAKFNAHAGISFRF